MATKLLNKLVSLSVVFPEPVFLWLSVKETMGYDKDGNPTNQTVGYTLTCVDLIDFQTIKVKVPKIKLPLTPQALEERRSNGVRTFVEFEEAFIKPYFNSNTKTVEDSISASNFHVVDAKL